MCSVNMIPSLLYFEYVSYDVIMIGIVCCVITMNHSNLNTLCKHIIICKFTSNDSYLYAPGTKYCLLHWQHMERRVGNSVETVAKTSMRTAAHQAFEQEMM